MMLFMCTMKWNPSQRDEAHKRRFKMGENPPPGVRVIGEWGEIAGGGGFVVYECDTAEAALAMTMPYSDMAELELVPVVDIPSYLFGGKHD
jgi:hypothetical protein